MGAKCCAGNNASKSEVVEPTPMKSAEQATVGGAMADSSGNQERTINPVVFGSSTAIIAVMLIGAVVAADVLQNAFTAIQTVLVDKFGWFYVISMTGILFFAIWIMQSRFGDVKLGPDDAVPDYSLPTWFAMFFSAGIGIGLLFYGVAEPMYHYGSPPYGTASSPESARAAMGITIFHWGLHPWAMYAVVGLALAYFSFRRGLPLSLRSAFEPLLGDKIYGTVGDVIDIVAVVNTLFGVATSLGLGALQVNAGLYHNFGVKESGFAQAVIITIITILTTFSVVSGLDVGIRRLSELNMVLSFGLLCFVFIAGPTPYLMGAFFDNLVSYIWKLPYHSFCTGVFSPAQEKAWLGDWTIFYWAWWFAWAPFVGMFIARVSRGRTIREFVTAILLVPTFASLIWFTVFGGAALYEETMGAGGIAKAVNEDLPTAIFVLLDRYPHESISGPICMVCVIVFFVTSSDSAALVVDTIASGGAVHTPVIQRVFWAVLQGVVAAVLLFNGGLKAFQTATLITALPLCILILFMGVGLVNSLKAHEEPELDDDPTKRQ